MGVESTVFFTQVSAKEQVAKAWLLIDSIRSFGGEMSQCPIWVFESNPETAPCAGLRGEGIEIIPLKVPGSVAKYILASKVFGCYQAEELAGAEVKNLVWLASDCLVIQSPVLFDLGADIDMAVRPVHIRNVGLTVDEPLNSYWQAIYKAVGLDDVQVSVNSYVDDQQLRAYYNSHMMSINPGLGLYKKWFDLFESLVTNEEFQADSCQDLPHRIFLHQAPLSALIAAELKRERIRLLPPNYIYPYNLQDSISEGRQVRILDDLTCITYEERPLHPDQVEDITINDPLKSWLRERCS